MIWAVACAQIIAAPNHKKAIVASALALMPIDFRIIYFLLAEKELGSFPYFFVVRPPPRYQRYAVRSMIYVLIYDVAVDLRPSAKIDSKSGNTRTDHRGA